MLHRSQLFLENMNIKTRNYRARSLTPDQEKKKKLFMSFYINNTQHRIPVSLPKRKNYEKRTSFEFFRPDPEVLGDPQSSASAYLARAQSGLS